MPSYAGPAAARPGDIAGTLRLLAYLALACALIVLDHRGGWLTQARRAGAGVRRSRCGPWPAGRARVVERISDDAGTRSSLIDREPPPAQRVAGQQRAHGAAAGRWPPTTRACAACSAPPSAAASTCSWRRSSTSTSIPPASAWCSTPAAATACASARCVIDAGGVLGQIIAVTPMHATVLLLTDPDHAVPVAVARNGVRLVAYGTGRSDRLALASVPLSSDVKVGDVLVTSGLGGRFPAGFPVGTIAALRPDDSRAFLVGDVKPAAQLDRGRDVLLLRQPRRERPVIGAGAGEHRRARAIRRARRAQRRVAPAGAGAPPRRTPPRRRAPAPRDHAGPGAR